MVDKIGSRRVIPGTSSSKEIVSPEDGDVGDGHVELGGDDNEGGVEERSVRGGIQHGTQTQDKQYSDSFSRGPVEGIVRVFRRLGSKNDVCIFARTVLQSKGDIGLCGFIVQQNRTGDVRKFMV